MTKLSTTLTLSAIASILIIGGFAAATPNAFSTYGGWYDDDDDCDDYGYHDDDDCGHDEPKDPCDCEKPDTLKFTFSAPVDEINSEFRIEVYKKTNYIGNEDKMLTDINAVMHNPDEPITLSSTSFHKDKLHSNTVFAVYKVDNDELVSTLEIHTSCSQDLYIGQIVSDNGYTLEITDGLKDGETSISASNPQTCGDEPEPEKTGTIAVRNALTADNGGQATFADFSYKVIDESGTEFPLTPDTLDPSIHSAEVPKGPYVLMQTIANTVSESYTEVLITGDKKCPTTTNESFMIKKDKTISCTIYNDDNGDGQSGGPGGIVFRNFSMKVQLDSNQIHDSCDQYTDVADKDPCIEIVNPENGDIAIVDSALISTTTIVLFSVAEEQLDPTEGAIEPDCTLDRIIQHNSNSGSLEDDEGDLPTNPTDNLVVLLQCPGMDMNRVYNVNYVMIDPTM